MRGLTTAAFAALAAIASAECPNACSGNGECGTKDQCECYDGFIGADCSQRICPYSLAFVDVPNGDLNHDGVLGGSAYSKVSYSRYFQPEYWPTVAGTIARDTASSTTAGGKLNTEYKGVDPVKTGTLGWVAAGEEGHWYQECSGKGVCDRATGECGCYDGYTGSACQRTTCPNDCSGHGRCKTVGDIAMGALNKKFVDSVAGQNFFSGVQTAFEYRLWDAEKNQACVCDSGYGGVDCSLRECPRGDDPLTAVPATCNGAKCANEVQTFMLPSSSNTGNSYEIVFYDFNNVAYTSNTFSVDTDTTKKDANAMVVAAALETLPNTILGNVTVTAEVVATHFLFSVTFDSLPGNVPEFFVNRKAGLDPVAQPYEPIHKIAIADFVPVLDKFTFSVNPTDLSGFRSGELMIEYDFATPVVVPLTTVAEKAAGVKKALLAIGGVDYELGSNGIETVAHGTDIYVTFSNNPNRPWASRKMGSNPIRLGSAGKTSTVLGSNGNTEYSICSNRGMCDFSSGLCACFGGYYGPACEWQSALAL